MGKIYKNGILFAGSTENAGSVAFNNAKTGLEAVNVQGAIEEIKSGIDNEISKISANLLPKEITVTSDYLHNAAHFYQIGHSVIANLYFNNLTLSPNTTLQIGAIEVPPKESSTFVCVFININNSKILGYGNLVINTSGIISIRSDTDMEQCRCVANAIYTCD